MTACKQYCRSPFTLRASVATALGGVLSILPVIAGQYLIKMGVTIVGIPLIYLMHAKSEAGLTRE